jgi:hypothetical protein
MWYLRNFIPDPTKIVILRCLFIFTRILRSQRQSTITPTYRKTKVNVVIGDDGSSIACVALGVRKGLGGLIRGQYSYKRGATARPFSILARIEIFHVATHKECGQD